jgi:hypothetical protein
MQIHQNGQLGMHTNLINDGVLDDNLGQAGFYGDQLLTVSGAFVATFYNLEIANPESVLLNTALNSSNNTIFILGNFVTPRDQMDNYLNFLENAISTSSNDISKVDGYVQINQKPNFIFPVGDETQLRPLILSSESVNMNAKCAYFFENPNLASTFPGGFDTAVKANKLGPISTREFWRLEGSVPSTVQLSWNARSGIAELTEDPTTVAIAGWSKTTNQWERLSEVSASGDSNQGFVSSGTFIPNDYEVLTLAASMEESTMLPISLPSVYVNANEPLVIPELEQSPNNSLLIFDRFGMKVFEKENYTNEFEGYANKGFIVYGRGKGLPPGVYFFIVKMFDVGLEYQSFFYLSD